MSKEDYNAIKKDDLVAMCEERGIEVPSGALKADLVKLLEDDDTKTKVAPEPLKKEAPKETAKPATKPATKPAAKPAAKPATSTAKKSEKKPAKSKSGLKTVEDGMAKIGYMDLWDYITLGVGIWGLVWTIVGFVIFMTGGGAGGSGTTTAEGIQLLTTEAPLTTLWYTGLAGLFTYIIQFYIYICLTFFPFVIKKLGMPLIKKWKAFPLHFIETGEDLRSFMIFIGFWSCVFFWIGSYNYRWPHMVAVIVIAIVMFADPLSKRSIAGRKIPSKKTKDY